MFRWPMPEEDTPLGITYLRDERNSHSYVNLKLQPERESELPELQKSSVLRDLVLTITKESVLQTFGCEVWLTNPAQSPWPDKPEYTFQAGSYLDLAFVDERKWSREEYTQLIDEFINTKKSVTTTIVGFQHKTIVDGPQPYRGIIWWNWGWGRTQKEAEENWERGIRLFKEFALEKYFQTK
jgi:hypothetical protein